MPYQNKKKTVSKPAKKPNVLSKAEKLVDSQIKLKKKKKMKFP
jgi:hypothetical protein